MAADVIQAKYDELEQVATRFAQQAEVQGQLLREVEQKAERLRSGSWRGKGIDAFNHEIDAQVRPAILRLTSALEQAQSVTIQISDVIRAAENEAASLFSSDVNDIDYSGKKGKLDEKTRIIAYEKSSDPIFFSSEGDTRAVDANDVAQGQIGNCFFVASLVAVTSQNPEAIRNAIKSNRDGTFSVTFYEKQGGFLGIGAGYKPVQITVTPEFPKREIYNKEKGKWVADSNAPHAGMGDRELWPRIIEKAYAQWKGDGNPTRGYQVLNKGGQPRDVLNALVGVDSQSTGKMNKYSIDDLSKLHKDGSAITLSSRNTTGDGGKGFYSAGSGLIHTTHAYWVESVDAKNNKIVVRNPWGYESSTTHRIEMTYQEFVKGFDRIDVNPLRR